jgi:hypothetical protein
MDCLEKAAISNKKARSGYNLRYFRTGLHIIVQLTMLQFTAIVRAIPFAVETKPPAVIIDTKLLGSKLNHYQKRR